MHLGETPILSIIYSETKGEACIFSSQKRKTAGNVCNKWRASPTWPSEPGPFPAPTKMIDQNRTRQKHVTSWQGQQRDPQAKQIPSTSERRPNQSPDESFAIGLFCFCCLLIGLHFTADCLRGSVYLLWYLLNFIFLFSGLFHFDHWVITLRINYTSY